MRVNATVAPASATYASRVLLWTLLIVYILNFLDRQIVNILAEPISRDLGLNDTQFGLMTGMAFALFYTVLGIPIARYADRPSSNRVRLISISLAIWSAMTALMMFAQNLIGLGLGPTFFGLLSDSLKPLVGAASVQWVLWGASWLAIIPALLFLIAAPYLRTKLKPG